GGARSLPHPHVRGRPNRLVGPPPASRRHPLAPDAPPLWRPGDVRPPRGLHPRRRLPRPAPDGGPGTLPPPAPPRPHRHRAGDGAGLGQTIRGASTVVDGDDAAGRAALSFGRAGAGVGADVWGSALRRVARATRTT